MSEARDDIARLCASHGIATGYYDIAGRHHAVAPQSLTALLGEFGVDATTPESVGSAIEAAEFEEWNTALPPVTVIDAGASAWTLRFRLSNYPERLPWALMEEQGTSHSGVFHASEFRTVSSHQRNGITWHEYEVTFALALPMGYHRLSVGEYAGETLIVAAPAHCYAPAAFGDEKNGRIWGVSLQLYSVRSSRNWGIGDFGDLGRLAQQWCAGGAGIVGLNPLHALFPHNPHHVSPYSPSSRLGLNVLYLDVEAIDDFEESASARQHVNTADFQRRLASLRETEFVDYAGVAAAKMEVLELLYDHFRKRHLEPRTEHARRFRDFQSAAGRAFHLQAVFDTLQAHFHDRDTSVWGWPAWPEDYRDCASEAVQRFAEQHVERVEWHEYLQWQAWLQLERIDDACRNHGMPVGLYLDLAISVDRGGADAWIWRKEFAASASVGAPPDEFNLNGQNWGLPPLRPDRLRSSRYEIFIETLRAGMRHAGALRIDHVMGLMRLFWIPPGKTAQDGAYVHYPLEEMLAILALESRRNRCLVIGEDLGTVTDELRAALSRRGIFSYKLLYFERHANGEFKRPEEYPENAVVMVGTHDLAPLAGWWNGSDLTTRLALGLYPDPAIHQKQLADRAEDRTRLVSALRKEGCLDDKEPTAADIPEVTPLLAEAVHEFIARAPARVMMVQIEDALGVTEHVNLPGTVDEHPNWRRKLPVPLEQMADNIRLSALAKVLANARPSLAKGNGAAPPPADTGRRAIVPRATYRLQLHHGFGFDAAARIFPYLARLGISHVYCSPILRARPGSLHGYDIVSYHEINPELGGREAFDHFSTALREHSLKLLLDIVPNHMGVLGADNAWWMDILENGMASMYAGYFDIDWHPANPQLDGKVLLPVLRDYYGDALTDTELALRFERDTGTLAIRYHEHRLPLDPRSYPAILDHAARLTGSEEARATLLLLSAAFARIPERERTAAEDVATRSRDKEVHKESLSRFANSLPVLGDAIAAAVAALNGEARRDGLHDLLEAQVYRLAHWRVAADEINYRRFFDINDLAALRMENEEVFEATHGFVLDLAAAGTVDGLRIDHPDGLLDPDQYLHRLQAGYARRTGIAPPTRGGKTRATLPLYIALEKITAPHERMPETWQCHGSTGYRFANTVNGVLVDTAARSKFDRIWRNFTGIRLDFDEIGYQSKRLIMQSTLAAERTRLANELLRIAQLDRRTRDYTFNILRDTLVEIAACLPVYRTYAAEKVSKQDIRYIDWAVAQARQRNRHIDTSVFDFVRRMLMLRVPADAPEQMRRMARNFVMRFQQFTAPVAAKGIEDTAFYRYSRLVSLNEVGGDPATFGLTARAFHKAASHRARWPHTMLATSTHDNKRSEDVRNRINVLSETAAAWRLLLRRWHAMNRRHLVRLKGGVAPATADEYLLYQILIGTCPAGDFDQPELDAWRDRIQIYMLKAAHEAKLHTSWTNPDPEYDAALVSFVGALLKHVEPNVFLSDLRAQAKTFSWYGALNSLSMALIKFTSPGVPDIYQGNESMDLSLVDPDNRRPVDYALRERLLDSLAGMASQPDLPAALKPLLQFPHDGRAKLWLTWRLLDLRRRVPELFDEGIYVPLRVLGAKSGHIVAYARRHGSTMLIVIAVRLFSKLADEPGKLPLGETTWTDTAIETELPDGTELNNVITGETLVVAGGRVMAKDAMASFPGAALVAGV